jgi:predicted RNase H-like nuclease (RuvC/YqgF family)
MTGEIDVAQQAISGGGWAGIFTGLGLAGTIAYKAFRKVKDDGKEDDRRGVADEAMSGVVKHLREEVDRQNEVIKEIAAKNEEQSDKIARLRTDLASAQAGNLLLQGKIANLETAVAELKTELAEAESKLKAYDTGDRRRATDRPDDRDRRVKE